jgi:hypothetical protein
MDREAALTNIARSFSRTIGYTTGAFDLERISTCVDTFEGKPSVYMYEIAKVIRGEEGSSVTSEYVFEIVNFAVALGYIYRIGGVSAGVSQAKSHTLKGKGTITSGFGLQKFAITELGSAVKAARKYGKEFFPFVLLCSVLEADGDSIAFTLDIVERSISSDEGIELYKTRLNDLRSSRYNYLSTAFSHPKLIEQFASRIPWLKAGKALTKTFEPVFISSDTARHHLTPRRGWLRSAGLISAEGARTPLGQKVVNVVFGGNLSQPYIGPDPSCAAAVKFPVPTCVAKEPIDDFIGSPEGNTGRYEHSEVLNVLLTFFPSTRLTMANQASLRPAEMFISWKNYLGEYDIEPRECLRRVIARADDQVFALSSRHKRFSYYGLR